jgi:hypothetical protein
MKKIIFFLFMMVLIASAAPARTAEPQDHRLLQTSASAEVIGSNDSVTIVMAVVTENKKLEIAHKENAAKSEAVLAAVKAIPLQGLVSKTVSYNVYPQRDYNNHQKIMGYRIQHSLAFTLEAMDQETLSLGSSQIVDTALTHGANQIASINFYIKDANRFLHQALAKATKNAMAKAQVMAKAASVHLGPLYNLTSQTQEPPERRFAMAAQAGMVKAAASGTPIEAGETRITATVHISYIIK